MGFKVGCFVSFFHPPENTCEYKKVILMARAIEISLCWRTSALQIEVPVKEKLFKK